MFCLVAFQGGDKLTLSLGNSPNGSGSSQNPPDKVLNSESSKAAPPAPPPRTTSDPNYKPSSNESQQQKNENNNTENSCIPVSVTYFSSGLNGHGIERETIFADDHPSLTTADAAAIVRQHLDNGGTGNPFNNSTNPFLDPDPMDVSSTNTKDTLDDLVEKKIQDLIKTNPFQHSGSGKFNTIGRSNPFSSVSVHSNSKNPFLDRGNDKIAATSSGEDVNDSPDSSLEPEDNELEQASINKIVSI